MISTLRSALEHINAKNESSEHKEGPIKILALSLPKRQKIGGKLMKEIHALAVRDALNQKLDKIFTMEEADLLWEKLSIGFQDRDVSFSEYKHIRDSLSAKYHSLFKASIFLQLAKPCGSMSVVLFFNYAIKLRTFCYTSFILVALDEAMIDLYSYDSDKDGLVSLQELELYIVDHVATLPRLAIAPPFLPFYARSCTKKLQFFHDPSKRGQISVPELLASQSMSSLLELRGYDVNTESGASNWFSYESTHRVYADFLAIDRDGKGFISIDDAFGWASWSLTDLVTRRVFREYESMPDELDFEAYIELILALLYIQTDESIRYWYKILDLDSKGYLNAEDFERLLNVLF